MVQALAGERVRIVIGVDGAPARAVSIELSEQGVHRLRIALDRSVYWRAEGAELAEPWPIGWLFDRAPQIGRQRLQLGDGQDGGAAADIVVRAVGTADLDGYLETPWIFEGDVREPAGWRAVADAAAWELDVVDAEQAPAGHLELDGYELGLPVGLRSGQEAMSRGSAASPAPDGPDPAVRP